MIMHELFPRHLRGSDHTAMIRVPSQGGNCDIEVIYRAKFSFEDEDASEPNLDHVAVVSLTTSVNLGSGTRRSVTVGPGEMTGNCYRYWCCQFLSLFRFNLTFRRDTLLQMSEALREHANGIN